MQHHLDPRLDLSALCGIPIAAAPAGHTSNFVDPPSQADLPRILTYITMPPMVIALALRFYTRVAVTRQVGLDDYLCLLAAATLVAMVGLLFKILGPAMGPHNWDIQVCDLSDEVPRNSVLQSILFPISAMFIKTAVLALYRRIFGPLRLANILILAGGVVTVAFYLGTTVAFCASCIPHASDYASGGWLSLTYDDRCNKHSGLAAGICGVVGAALDLYILLVPLAFIWGLRLSKRQKIGLASIFMTGVAAVAFSIAGAYFRYQLVIRPGYDLSWRSMPIHAMNIAEINIGIVCSCMPVTFVLFKGFFTRIASWVSTRRSRSRNSNSKGISTTTGATSDSAGGKIPLQRYREIDPAGKRLPDVPRGNVTGLRSFIRNVGRSRPLQSGVRTAATEPGTMMYGLGSVVEYDYHSHLRQDAGRQSPRPVAVPGQVGARQAGAQHPGRQFPTQQATQAPQGLSREIEISQESIAADLPDQGQQQSVQSYQGYDYLGTLRKGSVTTTITIGQAR